MVFSSLSGTLVEPAKNKPCDTACRMAELERVGDNVLRFEFAA